MLDGVDINLQRVRGAARVAIGSDNGLVDLYQQGSAKAMLPATHNGSPEVVFLNTSGGLTGGDRLSYDLSVGEGGDVTAATQTAERVYATRTGVAEVDLRLTVGARAHLNWMPQETILFDKSALHRTTRIDLADDATCVFAEMITLGRAAMGETVSQLDLLDRRVIARNGAPLFIDPLRLTSFDLVSRGPSGLGDATALATVGYIGPEAEDRLDPLRRILPDCAAASAWDGKLIVRAMSPDPYRLRCAVGSILTHLRGAALPRVWQI